MSILDFIRFPGDKKCYRRIHFREDAASEIYNDKMELQILELKKLPEISERLGKEEEITEWMRFLNGKSREEFKDMAQSNEYLGEAYEALQRLSADEKKRVEYEARDKALKDYNTQMSSARREGERIGEKRGVQIGEKRGEKKGIRLACEVIRLHSQKKTEEEIANQCNVTVEKVKEILTL